MKCKVVPDELERESKVKSAEKMKVGAIREDVMDEKKPKLGSEGQVEFRQGGEEKIRTEPNAQYRKVIHSSNTP